MGSANGDLLDFCGRENFFDLFIEDRQRSIQAGDRDVRPPAAPTTEPPERAGSQAAGTRRASGVQGLASRAGSNRGRATNIICSSGDLRHEAVC